MSNYTFEEVFSYEHLLHSADLCRRNVYWKASVQNFMYEKEYNVSVIHNELMNGTFKVKHRFNFDILNVERNAIYKAFIFENVSYSDACAIIV